MSDAEPISRRAGLQRFAALARHQPRGTVDVLDAALLGAALLLALVAVASLALAHLRVHSWPAVVMAAAVVVIAAVWAVRRWSPLSLGRVPRSAALVVPALLVAVVLFFPGFRYATGDKDPGIYVLHATSIADTGQLTIPKSPLQQSNAFVDDSGRSTGEWPGFLWHDAETEVLPSFYHLWPALMATAFDAVGFRALTVLTPLLALLAVALAFAVARRLANPLVAGFGALLLASNMMQVWQARYPTGEVLAQVLFLGAALAIALAVQTDRPPFAVAAGALLTTSFLARGEGVGMVMLAAAVVALAIGLQQRTGLAAGGAAGLALPLPFALYQAYDVAAVYSTTNHVPSLTLVAGLLAAAVLFAVMGHRQRWGAVAHRLGVAAWRRCAARGISAARVARGVATVAVTALFLIAVVRPWFGPDYFDYNGVTIRSYDERSLHRMAWFFSWPGVVLALVGVCWAIWTRWSLARALVLGAVLLFLVVFLFRASNSPYLMWWGRRFIPVAVPGLALLIAMSLGVARQAGPRAQRWRPPMAVWSAVLMAICVYQGSLSLQLRGHDEKAGSYGVAQLVAGTAGGQRGVYLWERGPCCSAAHMLFGPSTWVLGHADTAALPDDPAAHAAFVERVAAAAGDQPLFLVLSATTPLSADPSLEFVAVQRVAGSLAVWEEQSERRPDRPIAYDYDFIVYRVTVVAAAD